MRHLGSIALAIVFAPLMYLLTGIGEVKFVLGTAGSSNDWTAVGIGVGALIVAGLLYSIMAMARISPLGPILTAFLYIIVELWAVFSQSSLTKLLGTSAFGIQGAAEQPLSGIALFMAVPLIVTIVSPRRWRSKGKPAVATYPQAYPNQQYAQPTYPPPGSAAPVYQTTGTTAPTQTTAETAPDAQVEPEVHAEHHHAEAHVEPAHTEAPATEAPAEEPTADQ